MRSDVIKKGIERAPHRSLLWALGRTDEEMERPFVGVISSYNEIVPGHMHLQPDRRGGQERRLHGGRHALRVQHHRASATASPWATRA